MAKRVAGGEPVPVRRSTQPLRARPVLAPRTVEWLPAGTVFRFLRFTSVGGGAVWLVGDVAYYVRHVGNYSVEVEDDANG